MLVGTRSVAASEHLSGLLTEAGLPHRVLNARQDQEEAEIISQAGRERSDHRGHQHGGAGNGYPPGAGVAEIGGLHVIATERHEARRIDRQLFGRCGRQGDPGTNEAILSLEDELITVHVSKPLQWWGAAWVKKPRTRLARWVGKLLFARAQRAAEHLHARMRRDLLKMDEQLGEALAFSGRPE